jgi:LuxR family maltose regulon positive regulatory protein
LFLEELEQANLFLIPLDGNRSWYRYHHLFAGLLRQRLQRGHPQLVTALHRRAADWLAQHDLVDDAIRHLIAGKEVVQAANLLEQSNEALWMQGRLARLHHWLAFLPKELIVARPRLLLAQAWTHVLSDSAATTITALFQQAEAAILNSAADPRVDQQTSTTELQGVLAAIRAVYHSKQEDVTGALANAQQALACLPQQIGGWRSIALMCLGFAYEMNGAVRAAEETFTEAIRLCQTIGNHYSALVTTRSLARTYMVQGRLHLAAATYEQALTQAMQRGIGQLPNIAHVHINVGRLHYEWHNLATAVEQLQLGLDRLQGQGESWIQIDAYVLLARVKQSQGEVAAAVALLHQAEQVAQAIPFQWTRVATAAIVVCARLALGQDAGAEQWLAQAQPQLIDDLSRLREAEHFTAARVWIAQGRIPEALSFLSHIAQDAEGAGRMKAVVESCVLAAVAYQLQGDCQSAQAILLKALTLAEPEGYLRSFVDEGETIRQVTVALRDSISDSRL